MSGYEDSIPPEYYQIRSWLIRKRNKLLPPIPKSMSEVKMETFWRNMDSFFSYLTSAVCRVEQFLQLNFFALSPSVRNKSLRWHLQNGTTALFANFHFFLVVSAKQKFCFVGPYLTETLNYIMTTYSWLSFKKTLKFVLPTRILSDFETGVIAAAIAVFEIDQLIKSVLSLHPSNLQKNSIAGLTTAYKKKPHLLKFSRKNFSRVFCPKMLSEKSLPSCVLAVIQIDLCLKRI